MSRFISYPIIGGFITVIPFLLLYHFLVCKKIKSDGNNGKSIKSILPHVIAAYIFCFYLVIVLNMTGLSNILYLTPPIFKFTLNINLIPFDEIFSNSAHFGQYIANLMFFVPLGFLLPLLWKRFEKMRLTLLFGFLLSLAIEIAQLLTHRATDIDDILMNTLGTIVGYYLYICIKKILPKITAVFNDFNDSDSDKEAVYFRREVYVYIGIAWITVIFTQRFISSLLFQLLYR